MVGLGLLGVGSIGGLDRARCHSRDLLAIKGIRFERLTGHFTSNLDKKAKNKTRNRSAGKSAMIYILCPTLIPILLPILILIYVPY